jgi:hypothetical protein
VENQGNRTSESGYWMERGDEGVPGELLAVRALLLSVPHVACPDGFEARLQRRLAGQRAGSQVGSSNRNWSLGWAGVGLGFAAALVIAVVMFDFKFQVPGQSPIAGTPQQVSTPTAAVPQATPPASGVTPQGGTDPAAQQANAQPTQTHARKDSTPTGTGVTPPEELFHIVNGTGR